MAEAQAALQAALGRIGFSAAAQAAVVSQGFVNVALLGLMTADQVKQVCKLIREDPVNPVPINMLQQQMLLAFRFWVVNRQRLGLAVNADEFTAIQARHRDRDRRGIQLYIASREKTGDKTIISSASC
jgi:hypothetical protein